MNSVQSSRHGITGLILLLVVACTVHQTLAMTATVVVTATSTAVITAPVIAVVIASAAAFTYLSSAATTQEQGCTLPNGLVAKHFTIRNEHFPKTIQLLCKWEIDIMNNVYTYRTRMEITRTILGDIFSHVHAIKQIVNSKLTQFQPDNLQSDLLEYAIERFVQDDYDPAVPDMSFVITPSSLTPSEWLILVGHDNGKLLYMNIVTDRDNVIADQVKRGDAIAKTMKETNRLSLSYFDGDGRLTFQVLSHLQQQHVNVDYVVLDVYEIVESVRRWHILFYPKGTKNNELGSLLDKSLAPSIRDDTVIYLNFCSIGKYASDTYLFLTRHVGIPQFISFETRGVLDDNDLVVSDEHKRSTKFDRKKFTKLEYTVSHFHDDVQRAVKKNHATQICTRKKGVSNFATWQITSQLESLYFTVFPEENLIMSEERKEFLKNLRNMKKLIPVVKD